MATSPEDVRTGLTLVTTAAAAEVAQVAAEYANAPQEQASALFATAPLIVATYLDGSSALALDWYEELRDEAPVRTAFTPQVVTNLRQPEIGNAVAWATKSLRELEADMLAEIEIEAAKMVANLEAVVQREVAAGFWDTVTENVREDPDAVGWQRFARPDACPFCRMLADKGAVYRSEVTGNFAAHTTCHCVGRPKFRDGTFGEEADPIQYMASSKRRTPAQRKALREYLKANYGA